MILTNNRDTYKLKDNNNRTLISFSVRDFPSQCGMIILHNFRFPVYLKDILGKNSTKFNKDFKLLLRGAYSDNFAKLVASAVVGSNLDKLLNSLGFEKSVMRKNPNSGNNIRLWSLNI